MVLLQLFYNNSLNTINYHNIIQEFTFRTSTSSGPGGQHVNRSQTRVEVVFNISESKVLTTEQKLQLKSRLTSKLSQKDELIIAVQDSRSQSKNKELAVERMYKLIIGVLKERKKRVPTKPSKAAIEKRLENKRRISEKKQLRDGSKEV